MNASTYHLQLLSTHAAHNLILINLRIIKFLLSFVMYIIDARLTTCLFAKVNILQKYILYSQVETNGI